MASITSMDEDIGLQNQTEDAIPEPDEIEEPTPSADQEALWQTINDRTSADTLLREAKMIGVGSDVRKRLAALSLSATIERFTRANNLPDKESSALTLLIGRFAIHDLTLNNLNQEITRAFGDERGKRFMADKAFRELLQTWAPDAVLFSDQTAPLPRPFPTPPIAPAPVATPTPAPQPIKIPITVIKPKVETTPEAPRPATPSPQSPTLSEAGGEAAAPFILHEETSGVAPTTSRFQSSVSFDILKAPRSATPEKPISVKIEAPFVKSNTDAPKRVVHYSTLRTPLEEGEKGK